MIMGYIPHNDYHCAVCTCEPRDSEPEECVTFAESSEHVYIELGQSDF